METKIDQISKSVSAVGTKVKYLSKTNMTTVPKTVRTVSTQARQNVGVRTTDIESSTACERPTAEMLFQGSTKTANTADDTLVRRASYADTSMCNVSPSPVPGKPIPVVNISSRDTKTSDKGGDLMERTCDDRSNDLADEFVGYTTYRQLRVRRYYIHGIHKTRSSEASLRAFLNRKGVRVTFVRYFERLEENCIGASQCSGT